MAGLTATAPHRARPDRHRASATSRATSPRSRERIARGARRRRRARAVPRAGADRLPARGPAAQGALPARPREAASDLARRGRGHRRAGRLPRARRRRLQRARGAAPTARSQARLPQGRCCRTTASSTSSATSRPARAARCSSSAARGSALTICEDIWTPGPPASDEALAGARADPQRLRVAVPRAARASSASGCSSSARATTSPPSRSATWSAARTSWSSTATRWSSTTRGACSRARAAVRRGAGRRRRRPAGGADRAAARHAAAARRCARALPEVATLGPLRAPGARGRRPASAATSPTLLEPEAEVYAALVLGMRDYVRQERLRARRARALGRDRLGARRC